MAKKEEPIIAPPLALQAGNGDQALEIQARQSGAMPHLLILLYDALAKRSEKVMLDFTREAMTCRYFIDGVWHNVQGRDRALGDAMLVILKTLAALNPADRRNRQSGEFKIEHTKTKAKFNGKITSQGVPTGERVLLEVRSKKAKNPTTLDEIGMRDKMQEKLKSYLNDESGLVLISAPQSGGFTTTWNVSLGASDRLMRDVIGLESEDKPETDVENIAIHPFGGGGGKPFTETLRSLMLKEPDALVVPEFPDGQAVDAICKAVNEQGKLGIAGVKAKDAVEALLRIVALKGSASEFAKSVRAVLNVRQVRKLNDTCKQPYQPPPQLLQRLGIPANAGVRAFYREWQPPPPDPEEAKKKPPPLPPGACELCKQVGPQCNGLGYLGRTGVFELLEITDPIRQAIVQKPNLDAIRQLARSGGHRSLQEEGVLLVAQGVTSLQELQRALK